MKKIMLATLMAVVAGGASAQVYLEGAFGSSNLEVDCTGASRCEKSGTGAKLIGGYTVNPNIAVEVGYVNFGDAKFAGYTTVPRLGYGYADVTYKSTAFYIGGAARGELVRGLWGVARLGLAQVETKADVRFGSLAGSTSDTGANALFGLGLEYAVVPKFKVTAGVDFTQSPIAEGNTTATLRLLSIGAQYKF